MNIEAQGCDLLGIGALWFRVRSCFEDPRQRNSGRTRNQIGTYPGLSSTSGCHSSRFWKKSQKDGCFPQPLRAWPLCCALLPLGEVFEWLKTPHLDTRLVSRQPMFATAPATASTPPTACPEPYCSPLAFTNASSHFTPLAERRRSCHTGRTRSLGLLQHQTSAAIPSYPQLPCPSLPLLPTFGYKDQLVLLAPPPPNPDTSVAALLSA